MNQLSAIGHRLITRPVPSRLFHTPIGRLSAPGPGEAALTWLGTAGLAIEASGQTLLIDPFLTRPGIRATLTGPIAPDLGAVRRFVPKADVVLCTHSHHDHLLDVPAVALETGALVLGSASSINLCRASGVPEGQLRVVSPPETVEVGAFRLDLRASPHGKAVLGRVPLPGKIAEGVSPPLAFWGYRTLGALAALVEVETGEGPVRVFHLGSADFLPETVGDARCDVLAACAVGRSHRPGYIRELVGALRPSVVVPIHWDDFFAPLEAASRQLPNADVEGFCREVRAAGQGRVVVLDKLETLRIGPELRRH